MSKLGLVVLGIFTYVVLCYACTCNRSAELAAVANPKAPVASTMPPAPPKHKQEGDAVGTLYIWRRSGKVFLAGSIPTKKLKDTLSAEAAKRYGASGFVDKLTVASPEGLTETDWESVALKSVVWGGLGDIAITGKLMTLRGKQASAEAKSKRYAYIKGVLPRAWGLENQMTAEGESSSASTSTGTNDTTPANLQKFKAVGFRPGSAELTDEGRTLLDGAAEVMAATGATRYEIGGHTDDLGSVEANQNIAERRADAVRKHLMDQGISPERLEAKGYGEARPLTPDTSATSRARNRRIEYTELK